MAATACVLTAADSTSSSLSSTLSPASPSNIKTESKDKILYKPYLITSSKDSELVTPRTELESLRANSTSCKSPATVEKNSKYFLEADKTKLTDHSVVKLQQEELNSYTPPKHFSMYGNYLDSTHSPYYSTMIGEAKSDNRSFDLKGHLMRTLPCDTYPYYTKPSHRKRFDSVPSYETSNKGRLEASKYGIVPNRTDYEDLNLPHSQYIGKHQQVNLLHYSPEKGSESRSKSIVKPRFKYTPMREKLPELHPSDKSGRHWVDVNTSRNHPYYDQCVSPEKLPSLRSPFGRNIRYDTEKLKSEKDHYEKGLIETNEKRSSAFSVIQPSAIHRVYSSESGYSSDPTNATILRGQSGSPDAYTSQHLSRHPTNGYPSPHVPPLRQYHDQIPDENKTGHNKLHIYEEASKAALKAFDEHVEKMMSDTRDRNQFQSPNHPQIYPYKILSHELSHNAYVDSFQHKQKFSSSSCAPHPLVQVSTVDSTQRAEGKPTVGGLLGLTMVANEHLGQAIAKEKRRTKNNNCLHLWQFLRCMLDQEKDKSNKCIEWTNRENGEFRLIKTAVIADLWGQSKNRTCMTYEKMARAMRYYYKMKILEKVPHKRLHFRFGEKMLGKVLDNRTLKPLRQNSVTTINTHPELIKLDQYLSPQNAAQVYDQTNIKRPASEGSIPTNFHSSELKMPKLDYVPSQDVKCAKEFIQQTPVIRSTVTKLSTEIFDDAFENNEKVGYINHVYESKSNAEVVDNTCNQRGSDSDTNMVLYSGDDTPVSSPLSDTDGELVVDTEVE